MTEEVPPEPAERLRRPPNVTRSARTNKAAYFNLLIRDIKDRTDELGMVASTSLARKLALPVDQPALPGLGYDAADRLRAEMPGRCVAPPRWNCEHHRNVGELNA